MTPIIKRALISVADKTNLESLATALVKNNVEIVSTGGSAAFIKNLGLPVTNVSDYTGFPEIMDGRVKTLHPKIHAAILSRNGIDESVLDEHDIKLIDLVIVNLYPFQETIAKENCTYQDAVENIDVGGPCMIRSAAKNHSRVSVVVSPDDYSEVINALPNGFDYSTRKQLAAKAFHHTAHYDTHIATYFDDEHDTFPSALSITAPLEQKLRYGENPHQMAALYKQKKLDEATVVHAKQHQGKKLSFNNLVDADAALTCAKSFSEPVCVIVKHANPCGVAQSNDIESAYEKAYSTDPTSAFGGVIAFNRNVDASLAQTIIDRQFAEVVIAPHFDSEALSVFSNKDNIRILECTGTFNNLSTTMQVTQISGGLLLQESDSLDFNTWQVVTKTTPCEQTQKDLHFAWKVAKSVKSNAIVYAQGEQTIGIGAGQMSRVYSARIALIKAQEEGLSVSGSVMASDAFFPFSDAIEAAHNAGIRSVIQPGGSIRDNEIIATANKYDISMVFTSMRHFKH